MRVPFACQNYRLAGLWKQARVEDALTGTRTNGTVSDGGRKASRGDFILVDAVEKCDLRGQI